MCAAAKAMVEALSVIDRETGRFLVVKRAARLKLAARLLDAHSPPNQRRERRAHAQFVKPLG